jgi:hypothetical protein
VKSDLRRGDPASGTGGRVLVPDNGSEHATAVENRRSALRRNIEALAVGLVALALARRGKTELLERIAVDAIGRTGMAIQIGAHGLSGRFAEFEPEVAIDALHGVDGVSHEVRVSEVEEVLLREPLPVFEGDI